MHGLRQTAEPRRKTRMVRKPGRSSRVKKRRRRFCPECGGRIILARENEYYTATEPCCSSCGLVYSEDEYFWHYIINGDDQPLLCGRESPKADPLRGVKAAPVAAGQSDTIYTNPAYQVGSDTFEQKEKQNRNQRQHG